MDIRQLHKLFLNSEGVTTDTRNIKGNQIFFALKGENFNGNKYAETALNKGACFAIIDEEAYLLNDKCILVKDVLQCLQELANYHRSYINIPIVAITGTNGKTTTKELVSCVLNKKYNVGFTQGNLNNHIGVPLTLLSFNKETEIGIVEMGANHVGEIAELSNIANPDFGIITNIGKAHIEGFGSYEKIIQTKSELYEFIKKGQKKVFVNGDDDLLLNQSVGIDRLIYGKKANSFIKAEFIGSDPYLEISWNDTSIMTNLVGEYNFYNALAAIAVGKYFDVEVSLIGEALSEYKPENNRSQLKKTDNNLLVIDAYNANPTSMSLAIKNFENVKGKNKVLILGDMFELGATSDEEHHNIIKLVDSLNYQETYFVGTNFSKLKKDFQSKYHFYNSTEKLCSYLKLHKIVDSTILLKASRGIKLEDTIEYL